MPLTALENGLATADIAVAASSVHRMVTTGERDAEGEATLGWRAVAEHAVSIYLASDDSEGGISVSIDDLALIFRNLHASVHGGEEVAFDALTPPEQEAWRAVARIATWATQTHEPRDLGNGVGYFAASAEERLRERGIVRQ